MPVLTIDSTPPVSPESGVPITIQATSDSTDAIYTANLIYQVAGQAKDSTMMVDNGGTWEATVGPFDPSDHIDYYVSITDNSGRRERSADKSFSIPAAPDYEDPEWRNQGQSNSNPVQGTSVLLHAEGRDNAALRYATLETNETGVWERKSAYGSPMDLGDVAETWTYTGFDWVNPSVAAGTIVSWRIWYEDASGNEVSTDTMSFTVEAPFVDNEPPEYFDPSTSSTDAGVPVEFSLRWTDNVGLDGYVFSLDNGTGSFVDDPFVKFTEGVSGDTWWDPDWSFKRDITIDNTTASEELVDYPVLVTVDTASAIFEGKMTEHGGDIRFIDDDQELDYWVESGMNTSDTRIWVKVPGVAASSSKVIHMYYGNPNRTVPQSDGSKVFPAFDNFGGRGWEELKYSGNPVMGPGSTAGGSGTFSSVIRESDTVWKMYGSYDSDGNDIGLSTSTDGLNWVHQGAVVRKGASGEWDASNIWCPGAWKEGDTYYMLYSASGSSGIQMGLASSSDGVLWTKYAGNPVFNDPNWATGDTEAPGFSVLKEGDTYYIMYNTLSSWRRSSVAYSTDLINWTPAYSYPRFIGSTSTSSWNYNMFCGNVIKYEDKYYLVIPGQDSSRNYVKMGLYVSGSPTFPEADTEFKGIVMIGGLTGWDSEDMDTPWHVMYDGKINLYYAGTPPGGGWSRTGVALIDDIPAALSAAYPPGNYIETDRSASASLMIMPPVGWGKSITGYQEVDSQNFLVTLDPAVTGRSIILHDGNATNPLQLYKDTSSVERGVVSAWLRADNTNTGDYDLCIYGDGQTTLAAQAGFSASGVFHYWNGGYTDTAVACSADTWYLLQLEFDSSANKYNFAVYDEGFSEILRVDDVDFGGSITTGIDRIELKTSAAFNGDAYVDDVRLRPFAGDEPLVAVSDELTPELKESWSRVTKTVTSTLGATIRWKVAANDTSGNWTTSAVYSFTTTLPDDPPTITMNYPDDEFYTTDAAVDFSATCSDERDVAQVSLWADWNGSWEEIETVYGPGINGAEVIFSKTVPDGSWTWNIQAFDDTGHENWGVVRSITVESSPPPWWHSNYEYRRKLIAHENSGHALTQYPMYVVVDTAALIADGKMLPDCSDVRITYDGVEIPSQVMDPDSTTTKIWLQADLSALESKHGFYLYYGNPSATALDYSSDVDIAWDDPSLTMNTGKITSTFYGPGGIIGQVKNNANNTDTMINYDERGVGYLFSNNSAVWYIFRCDETDDSVALTVDGPIVKVVTAYSGESPQWVQENYFYNNQDFIDLVAHRPAAASSELYLTGASDISPDGVFSTAETNELLRADDASADTAVTFNDAWQYSPTPNRGYVGLVDPSYTNEMAMIWDESQETNFTWKPRTGSGQAGSYSLFIGGDGTTATYGTIDSDTFEYRFVLHYSDTPDNANTQQMYDYCVTDPPTVTFGPEELRQVDITPPDVTITSPLPIVYDTSLIPLTFDASEAISWAGYTLNGGSVVEITDFDNTVLDLENGDYDLVVYAKDFADNEGQDSVSFTVEVVPFGWWDDTWLYRMPVTVNTGAHERTNAPIELAVNFTDELTDVGASGSTFDPNSVRVVEYTSAGDMIGEVASQFDADAGYDPTTNAAGTVVWIMDGTTPRRHGETLLHLFRYNGQSEISACVFHAACLESYDACPLEQPLCRDDRDCPRVLEIPDGDQYSQVRQCDLHNVNGPVGNLLHRRHGRGDRYI